MRNKAIIICLIVTIFLNTNIQISHVAGTILTANHMTSSDTVHPVWMQELQEHEIIEIYSDSDFVDQGWSGNGSVINPFIIEGIMIRAEFSSIMIWNTTKHFEIRRCIFTRLVLSMGGGPALNFRNVTNGRVTNCFINGTIWGILIRNSTDCQVTDNVVFGNMYSAIEIEDGLEVLIANNTLHNTGSGIKLMETTNFTVRDNRIYECYRGVHLTDVQSSNILGNTIWKNSIGIDLTRGHSIITNNSIYGNSESGIRVKTGIASNTVYGNRIGWNGVQNAEDNSNSTEWDDGIGMGNSWSDYNGTGQYPIPGSSTSLDRWPSILVDNTSPRINHPPDIEYVVGESGYNITWIPEDDYPESYEIFINETLYESGDWDGSEIVIIVDGHDIGVYNFTLVVYNIQGQNTLDTVYVRVRAQTTEPPPDYFGLAMFLLGIGLVGFIITFSILYASTLLLKRFRGENDSEDTENIALEDLKTDISKTLDTPDTSLDLEDE
ncbi:MAG: right-handed parallel beta-helix repeat-containing protein [Candidatus Thorarchaeota archaeon]